ncbi:hypothetical protein BSKO_06245 [Bryopsis sp. KO-2023]|nr:hypothetical protein BSKO_06245 [Bryopsis sp. KO-2023]
MNYKFSNLLGAPYRGGTILLNGHELLSPVGNRAQVVDLAQSTTSALPFDCPVQIRVLCVSPCGRLLLVFDEAGGCVVANKNRRTVLHRFRFGGKVGAAKFSPDGKYIAIGKGKILEIWKRPGLEKHASPMEIYRSNLRCQSDITSIDWSEDSFGIAVGSKDQACRVFTLDPVENYKSPMLAHRRPIVGVFFTSEAIQKKSAESGMESPVMLLSCAKDGLVYEWGFEPETEQGGGDEMGSDKEEGNEKSSRKRKADDSLSEVSSSEEEESSSDSEGGSMDNENGPGEDAPQYVGASVAGVSDKKKYGGMQRKRWKFFPGQWKFLAKHHFNKDFRQKLTAVDLHKDSGLLVGAFSNGVFELVQMPGFERLQTLSVCQQRLSSISFSPKGDWIAVGSARLGQLLVWEWRSESYVLKQQGHQFDVNSTAFSPDGAYIATGADDSKVKIYSMSTGFCFATFTEHTMPVTVVQFMPSGHALCSASKDGTVRAFDLVRYRNFRTFTTPEPVQFISLAVDPKGEVVVAGSLDTYQIFVWSMKTGRLLDMLAAHQGPVVSLAFSPTVPVLASASWDKVLKLWDVFSGNKSSVESFDHSHEVLAVAYRPDSKQIACSTLEGNINFWDPKEGENQGAIEGRRDIYRGRFQTDRRKADIHSVEAHFTTLVYSADGSHILGGGKSKYVCIYDVEERVLLRRIQTTYNRGFDGVLDRLHSGLMTDSGPLSLIDDEDSDREDWDLLPPSAGVDGTLGLPGTSQRGRRPVAQSRCIALSPTGRSFAVAATEGLLVFSLDDRMIFDPTDLAEDITPAAVDKALGSNSLLKALLIALRLKDQDLIQKCVLATPVSAVPLVAKGLPDACVGAVLTILAETLRSSPHLEFLLTWAKSLCGSHGSSLTNPPSSTVAALKSMQRALTQLQADMAGMCESNLYTLEYLAMAGKRVQMDRLAANESGGEETDIEIK